MKTKKEVVEMVGLLKRLQVAMPRQNAFGESNFERTGSQIRALETVVKELDKGGDKYDIESLLDESYDEGGSEAEQDAYNWALGDLSDDLTDEKEVAGWEAKRSKGVR